MGATVGHLGYPAIFLVLFLEAVGIPSPDEATLFLAGMAAGRGLLSGPLAMLAAFLGAFLGSLVSYTLARRLGRPLVLRYGQRVGLTEARLAQAEAFVARYEQGAVFLGRIVTGVRLVIGYAAGVFEIPPAVFAVWSALGAATWAILDVGAGMLLGHEVGSLRTLIMQHLVVSSAAALVVLAGVGAYLLLHRRAGQMRRR